MTYSSLDQETSVLVAAVAVAVAAAVAEELQAVLYFLFSLLQPFLWIGYYYGGTPGDGDDDDDDDDMDEMCGPLGQGLVHYSIRYTDIDIDDDDDYDHWDKNSGIG
jgi:hypothetical protein